MKGSGWECRRRGRLNDRRGVKQRLKGNDRTVGKKGRHRMDN